MTRELQICEEVFMRIQAKVEEMIGPTLARTNIFWLEAEKGLQQIRQQYNTKTDKKKTA